MKALVLKILFFLGAALAFPIAALSQSVFCWTDTSTVAGTDFIYRPLSNIYPEQGTIEWQFAVDCSVKNSSVNNFKIYLIANDSLQQNDNYTAFAIGTGLKTGIYSQLCLLKYTGKDFDILAATNVMFDNALNNINLAVKRTSKGEWLLNDDTIYIEPQPQMYIADYMSVEYKHSTTGNGAFTICCNGFNFTNTGNTIEAKLSNAEIVSDGVVNVKVEGRIDPQSAVTLTNYQLNGCNPDSVYFWGNALTLFFNSKIFSNTELQFSAQNLVQIGGGTIANYQSTLLLPMYGDIVINEIMCDISPAPSNLPTVKYIELFNPTNHSFSLKNCFFVAGDYRYVFPETNIDAGEYLLICRYDSLDSYAKTVKRFDDSKIVSKDRKLSLINQSGYIVDSLTYTLDMYGDKVNSSGGYSLERRDPRNLFMVNGNWTASLDISGGTPGRVNSTLSTVSDNKPPIVTSVSVIDNNTLQITFSKNIVADASKFWLNDNVSIDCNANLSIVTAKFSDVLVEGDNKLQIKSLADYVGNNSNDTVITINYHRLKLLNVYAASQYQLCFVFNNDLNTINEARFYAANQKNATVKYSGNTAFVGFEQIFTPNTVLNASVSGIMDIYGNVIDTVADGFVYHNTERYDILITEVLFYPLSSAKRFVEIYNNSSYPVPLNQFAITYYDNSETMRQSVIQGGYLLQPQQYAVITQDTAEIKSRYTTGGIMIQDTKLPSFSNTQGSIVLHSPSGVAIDSMFYNRTESNTLEINVQGISLERVGFNPNSTDITAWKFATSSFDYATPGLPNSHAETPVATYNNSVTIVNELFTPDGDGYNDEVEIVVSSTIDDTAADISIYDSNGILKRRVASRVNIGNSASFFWNGLSDSGDYCKSGIYVIYVKTISPDGKTDIYKKVCVLSRR